MWGCRCVSVRRAGPEPRPHRFFHGSVGAFPGMLPHAAALEFVEGDGEDDDRADDHLLDEGGDP